MRTLRRNRTMIALALVLMLIVFAVQFQAPATAQGPGYERATDPASQQDNPISKAILTPAPTSTPTTAPTAAPSPTPMSLDMLRFSPWLLGCAQ